MRPAAVIPQTASLRMVSVTCALEINSFGVTAIDGGGLQDTHRAEGEHIVQSPGLPLERPRTNTFKLTGTSAQHKNTYNKALVVFKEGALQSLGTCSFPGQETCTKRV